MVSARFIALSIASLAVGLSTAAASSGPSGTLFVANKAEGSVSKIRLSDGREVKRDEACETPHELAASPDGAYLAVGCVAETQLSKIAEVDLTTGTVMGRLAGGVGGDALAIVE